MPSKPDPPHERLSVYLAGEPAGAIERRGPDRYRFRYAAEALAGRGSGETFLSMSLPLRGEPFAPSRTRPFFEGLLPEGAIREAVARQLGVSPGNGFALLRELGVECAGAVVIVPEGVPPPAPAGEAEPLSEEELAELVAELPSRPLGIAAGPGGLRLSLAGVQPKLVLTRTPSGDFGQPLGGAPSTHILKPQPEEYEDLVANEAFCLQVARCAGNPAARAEALDAGGHPCLLVERFDRAADEAGRIVRVHQEDACQALGVPPIAKYEGEGGPSLAQLVQLIRDIGSPAAAADINVLVAAVVLNLVLGNSDAHGKNFAFLYGEAGGPRLAPLYDLVSTDVYPGLSSGLAMTIGGVDDPERVDASALRALARECGLGAPQLVAHAREHAKRVARCARTIRDTAHAQGWHRPLLERIVALCERRSERLAGP